MRSNCFKIKSSVFLVMILSIGMLWSQDINDIRDMYQQGKRKCINREWHTAITIFEELLDKYPGNKYEDDAKFWIGYCLEKIPEQRQEAFNIYSKLVDKYPDSPWVDDAQVHQINLAEQFVINGQEFYRTYLIEQMGKEQKEVQYRAAIALGRIGDKKALPVLHKMQGDEDFGDIARDLISILQIERMSVEEKKIQPSKGDEVRLFYDTEQIEEDDDKSEILWFSSKRYDQYQKMLRKDDDWSDEELSDFALWHIIDTDEFEEYKMLNEYDKNEWRRKFWKRRDPTPTTGVNEYEEEFKRRIDYAKANFSRFWNYYSFKYLPDQYLRLGWSHAPWDARGELYIKYGAPEVRSQHGWHSEQWTYYRYNVDFLVRQFMTNIYGNAIHSGEMSVKMYGHLGDKFGAYSHLNPFSPNVHINFSILNNVIAHLQANFIFNNEIRYTYNYKANPIETIKVEVKSPAENAEGRIILNYFLPVDEIALIASDKGFEARFKEVYCVLNEDLREVARSELIRKIGNIPDDKFTIKEDIFINLPSGSYTLYLRIEDQNADNLGIYTQEFTISEL